MSTLRRRPALRERRLDVAELLRKQQLQRNALQRKFRENGVHEMRGKKMANSSKPTGFNFIKQAQQVKKRQRTARSKALANARARVTQANFNRFKQLLFNTRQPYRNALRLNNTANTNKFLRIRNKSSLINAWYKFTKNAISPYGMGMYYEIPNHAEHEYKRILAHINTLTAKASANAKRAAINAEIERLTAERPI